MCVGGVASLRGVYSYLIHEDPPDKVVAPSHYPPPRERTRAQKRSASAFPALYFARARLGRERPERGGVGEYTLTSFLCPICCTLDPIRLYYVSN